jgi:hypothetical protein
LRQGLGAAARAATGAARANKTSQCVGRKGMKEISGSLSEC